jgi:hypothetical protein
VFVLLGTLRHGGANVLRGPSLAGAGSRYERHNTTRMSKNPKTLKAAPQFDTPAGCFYAH